MEAYNQDLKEKSRSKEELDSKLKWVLDRANAYADEVGLSKYVARPHIARRKLCTLTTK